MNIELTKNISIGKNKRPIIVAEISSNHNSKKSLFSSFFFDFQLFLFFSPFILLFNFLE